MYDWYGDNGSIQQLVTLKMILNAQQAMHQKYWFVGSSCKRTLSKTYIKRNLKENNMTILSCLKMKKALAEGCVDYMDSHIT